MAVRPKGTRRRLASRPARAAADLAQFMADTAGRGNWGHPGLARVLRGVTAQAASWKPAPDAHSIWEEVNHIAYWSEDVLERLEQRGRRRRQAWPEGTGDDAAWRRTVARVHHLHRALRDRLAAQPPAALGRIAQGSRRYTNAQLALGCASHIAYHAGRIALLRRLYRHARQPVPETV